MSRRELLFGAAFLLAAVGASADWWGRDRSYYAEVAREERLGDVRYHFAGGDRVVPLGSVLQVDDETRSYVVDGGEPGAAMLAFFDAAELAHLRDVQRVFGAVRATSIAAALVMALAGLGLARARIRRAALGAGTVVVLVGAGAAVAFEPLFLAFHQVLFPQGNFLFDPSRENLVLVYPEPYWLGVTLRLGATVVLAALLVAAFSLLPIRSSAVARSTQRKAT